MPTLPYLAFHFMRGMAKDAARSMLPGVRAKLVGLGEKRMCRVIWTKAKLIGVAFC